MVVKDVERRMEERRKCVLTETDIALIREALISEDISPQRCRYNTKPEEFEEIIRFVRSIMEAMSDSKRIIRRLIIGALFTGILAMLGFKAWGTLK